MATVVSFQDVIEALEAAGDESVHFLNPETGEVLMITDEDRRLVEEKEEEESWDDLPKWRRVGMPKIREFLLNPQTLQLPGKLEIHERQIMLSWTQGYSGCRSRCLSSY